MKRSLLTLTAITIFIGAFFAESAAGQKLYFRDTALTPRQRAEDIVARLTLEEKAAQMLERAPAIPRLGIPAYNWWNECLHGIGRTPYPVTSYPQAIAMAATWNRAGVLRTADQISTEGRAIYNDAVRLNPDSIPQYHGLTYWTPNINIFRDPRWGRGQETWGEDPWLTATLGGAFVRGLQGDNPRHLKASACAKHYAVHSGPEWNRHTFDAQTSDYDLWDSYLAAFRELVVEAGVTGVMTAYNRLRGEPCSMSEMLLTDILYNRWGFGGYVTSDCGAINDIWRNHRTAPDAVHAAALAVAHGTHTDCGDDTYLAVVQAVSDGLIDETKVDEAVEKLFEIRIRLGMFDPVGAGPWDGIGTDVLEAPAHKAHALDMARQSIVLLRNEAGTLPLSHGMKKIAVFGPNADNRRTLLGNYEGTPTHVVSALEGIRRKVGSGVEVVYHPVPHWVTADEPATNVDSLAASVADADAIIYVGGLSPEIEGEEMPVEIEGFRGGDRTSIALPAIQTSTLKALHATGRPVIFVVMTGGAIAMPWERANLPAIVCAWYGGQAGGEALADVLWGDHNPSGRLPMTFYASDGDLPDFEDYSMAGRTYRYFAGQAAWRFGHGLSYTTFSYSGLKMSRTISAGRGGEVSVVVTNTGAVAGDEVVQLYLTHHVGADEKAPQSALRGFERVHLAPGESRRVNFTLTEKELARTGVKGVSGVRPGRVTVWVGGVSPAPTAGSSSEPSPIATPDDNMVRGEFTLKK